MKLALAGFSLESVTFLPATTGIEDFERSAQRGESLIDSARGTNSVLGGFITVAEQEGIDLIGLVSVNAGAAAAASDEALSKYTGEIVDGLLRHRDEIEGCLLYLHGALATPTERRADASVLAAIREALGADFPIGVGMDLHGNIGPANLEHATVLAGYYYSPHTDMASTGERAARLLIDGLRGRTRPTLAIAKPGIILPSIFSATVLEPLAELIREARRLEAEQPEILDISIFCGFAYADVPDCGMAIVVVGDGDPELARRAAQMLSDQAWAWRDQLFKRELIHSVDSGLDAAAGLAARAKRPICVLEHADRMNDSTYTLRAILERDLQPTYVPFLFDPDSAAHCIAAGEGARVQLEIGGKSSPRAGAPVALTATVLWAGHKRIAVTGPLYTGRNLDLGPCALIRVGGTLMSLISIEWSAIDLDCFEQFGLDPMDFRFILLRSKTHFRHVYEPLCEAVIIIDTPDWGPADVSTLPYQHADRRAYPLTNR